METSQSKTKRKIIKELSKEEYKYSSVIFFVDYTPNIFDYASGIRKIISRKVNSQIFWLVRVKRVYSNQLDEGTIPDNYSLRTIVQPYLQFFTSEEIDTDKIDETLFSLGINAECRSYYLEDEKKERWLRTFKIQKLANLQPFVKASSLIRTPPRWAITNKGRK
jgi:hypothetical protein